MTKFRFRLQYDISKLRIISIICKIESEVEYPHDYNLYILERPSKDSATATK
jgi:hypothetical protein